MTASADAVRTLLDRVAARMRWGRARDVAGKVSLVALAVVIVEGLVARIVPLPSWQPVLVTLAVVPLAAGVVLLLRAPPERAVRRTAGDWIDTPSLFLSSSGSRKTALHPLVANAASRAAAERLERPSPPRRIDALARWGLLLYLPALLTLAAPGRRTADDARPDAMASAARTAAAALRQEGLPESVGRDRRAAVQEALDQAAATGDAEAVARALRELEAAIRETGGDPDAFAAAAREAALLAPVHRALAAGDVAAARRALQDLARRIRDGEIDPAALKTAGAALVAAAKGAGTSRGRTRLNRAGDALQNGDGAGLERALGPLLNDLVPKADAVHRMQKTVVALNAARGAPASHANGGAKPGTPGEDLVPRAGEVGVGIEAFSDPAQLSPLQRAVLRSYFANR
ncbi:MAG: hypothetical protein CMJ83_00325 [Planctomycetes bacterium]|nr:hypothetical protein [Planctomycetota bacterium]